MVGTRNAALIKSELIRYITSLGLVVNTITKARGNKGFFKAGRIDVSKMVDDESAVRVLIHEFAHYVNYRLDKMLSSLKPVFGDDSQEIVEELISVTIFVDNNSQCKTLNSKREEINNNIKNLTYSIKSIYPNFSPNKKFKEFNTYSRGSNLRYLEKYDQVRINSFTSKKLYTIESIKKDFPDIPQVFENYIKLKSELRKRAKVSQKISKINRYYKEPCELFARFIEGLYLDTDKVKQIAPIAFQKFCEMDKKGVYFGLREIFGITRVIL